MSIALSTPPSCSTFWYDPTVDVKDLQQFLPSTRHWFYFLTQQQPWRHLLEGVWQQIRPARQLARTYVFLWIKSLYPPRAKPLILETEALPNIVWHNAARIFLTAGGASVTWSRLMSCVPWRSIWTLSPTRLIHSHGHRDFEALTKAKVMEHRLTQPYVAPQAPGALVAVEVSPSVIRGYADHFRNLDHPDQIPTCMHFPPVSEASSTLRDARSYKRSWSSEDTVSPKRQRVNIRVPEEDHGPSVEFDGTCNCPRALAIPGSAEPCDTYTQRLPDMTVMDDIPDLLALGHEVTALFYDLDGLDGRDGSDSLDVVSGKNSKESWHHHDDDDGDGDDINCNIPTTTTSTSTTTTTTSTTTTTNKAAPSSVTAKCRSTRSTRSPCAMGANGHRFKERAERSNRLVFQARTKTRPPSTSTRRRLLSSGSAAATMGSTRRGACV